MRGAHVLKQVMDLIVRIIPADAGSTLYSTLHTRAVEDHPRGCGEHTCSDLRLFAGGGSSPRMRGARERERTLPLASGIIPADAGSTSGINGLADAVEDHPRGCGEHAVMISLPW